MDGHRIALLQEITKIIEPGEKRLIGTPIGTQRIAESGPK